MDTIVSRFAQTAGRQPRAAAIAWRRATWDYASVHRASLHVRNAVAARALEPHARIALLVRNSPHYAALYYGALAAGAAAVPLNTQERASVLARQIGHCGARVVYIEGGHPESEALVNVLAPLGVEVVLVSLDEADAALERFAQEVDPQAARACEHSSKPQDLATIIYTSGTTGRPKGVMLSHANLAANTASIIEYLRLTPADRGLCVLPFHFSYGASVLHTHLVAGAVLSIEDNLAFPKVTVQRMQDERITGFPGVPSTFALLLGRCDLREFDLSALRYVTQAGGAMPRPLIDRLRQQAPQAELFIMYGQTEATARLTYLPPAQLDARGGSVGIPLPGVEIKVFTGEGAEAAPGEAGEICARGPNIMLGYWADQASSADALRDGWLHTGDLGHKDADGYLYIDGRAVDMIKVGAFRISPLEVEEAIAALPGVEEVGVVAIPDELLGHAIKAVIVPRAGVQLDVLAVKAHCRQHLAAYKTPKIVEFASTLPRTSSGKIQRYKLTQAEVPT